jgi:hypothetical protein
MELSRPADRIPRVITNTGTVRSSREEAQFNKLFDGQHDRVVESCKPDLWGLPEAGGWIQGESDRGLGLPFNDRGEVGVPGPQRGAPWPMARLSAFGLFAGRETKRNVEGKKRPLRCVEVSRPESWPSRRDWRNGGIAATLLLVWYLQTPERHSSAARNRTWRRSGAGDLHGGGERGSKYELDQAGIRHRRHPEQVVEPAPHRIVLQRSLQGLG